MLPCSAHLPSTFYLYTIFILFSLQHTTTREKKDKNRSQIREISCVGYKVCQSATFSKTIFAFFPIVCECVCVSCVCARVFIIPIGGVDGDGDADAGEQQRKSIAQHFHSSFAGVRVCVCER